MRRLSHEQGTCRNVKLLITMQKQADITFERGLSILEVLKRLADARRERRRCKDIAESLQIEYRHDLAAAKEAAGNIKAAVHLRNMNRVEATRKMHQNIRYMEGKLSAGATAQVTVTSHDGTVTELTAKDDVEKAIIKSNEKRYHQTEGGSQLISDAMVQDLGSYGDGPRVEEVLNGTYTPPPGTSEATKDFLQACQYPDNLQRPIDLPTPVRYWNVVKTWKQRKEATTSANQHIGHYKAIMKHPNLSWLLFQRAEIPIISGYSPSRHRKCVDLMIMKKAMSFSVEKQRALGILDSEFNHNNRSLQYDAMQSALKNNTIAVEQYSRPARSCIAHALNRRLTADDRQSKRLCWALAMSDLTGCYDRIIHNAAALALLRIGVSHAKIHSMFGSIQRMIHRVRTVFGDSETTYGGDDFENWLFAPQGSIQGNAAGPAIWSILSSIVFKVLHKNGHSDSFCSAISKQLFLLVGFAYVDDCDLIQSGTDPLTVAQSMQGVIQQWGDLMEVTGGALNLDPSKSYWYLVEYVWKRGSWVAADADIGGINGFDLMARNADNEWISLTRLQCNQASEMLGLFMAPSGDKSRMLEKLRTTAVEWAAKVRSGTSSQEETWTALKSTISRKLVYPLPALTLTEAECRSIMAPALKAALPRAGISSTISSVVRHAPSESLGLDVLDTEMGTLRTSFLAYNCWQQTPTGILLNGSIENQLLEMGLYGSIWENSRFPTYSKYCSNHAWLFHVCEFNNQKEIHLSIPHTQLCPKRIHDRALMDIAADFLSSKGDLKAFNRVRMMHGVVSLSDITTANGRSVDRIFLASSAFEGSRNDYYWPVKHHVSPSDYTVWRKTLEFIFPNEHLLAPLGNWIMETNDDWLKHWEWFVTSEGQFLYYQDAPDRWHRFLRKPHSHHSFFSEFLVEREPPSVPLLRATVEGDVDSLFLICSSDQRCRAVLPTKPPLNIGLHSFTAPEIEWLQDNLESSEDLTLLLDDLHAGKAVAACDGSYFETRDIGAAAWIVSSSDGSSWIQGGGRIPGPISDLNSYRCELGGLLGIADITKSLSSVRNSGPFLLTNACDNLEAVKKIVVPKATVQQTWKSVDLIAQILDIWQLQQGIPLPKHVYAHQDDKRMGPLSFLEHLNVKMDHLAKRIAISNFTRPPRNMPPSSLGLGTIRVGTDTIVSSIQRSMTGNILHKDMVVYLADRWELDEAQFQTVVHWRCLAKARKQATFPIQKFISKWVSEDTATGLVMVRRKQRDSSACPRCNADNEHLVHILTCPQDAAKELTHSLLDELEHWLIQEDTHPQLTAALLHTLTHWFDQPYDDEPILYQADARLLQALAHQDSIGWYAFLMGCISTDIIAFQHRYYTILLSRKKGTSWGKRLILKCWNIIYQLWMHRNAALHDTEAIDQLSGADKLQVAIMTEHTIGRSSLHRVYNQYFTNHSLQSLLLKPILFQKQWFRVIRTGREAVRPHTVDEFTTNTALRRWIGLPPKARI